MDKDAVYRYAIKNAFLHEGKANVNAVVGKIIALSDPSSKPDLRKLMPAIQEIVKQVNGMDFSEIEKEYKKFEDSYELKIPEKKEGLPELEWAEDESVITRYAPNPNGPFHLGNARAALLSYEFAKKYKGRFLLRFEDTDPKIKKPIENAEEIFKEDLHWLKLYEDETFFQSDRLDTYYDIIKQLIENGNAYACNCNVEEWRNLVKNKEACKCRDLNPEENLERFNKMLKNEIKQGEAVVRLKTDLKHADPSVRDYWIARSVDNPQHVRQKGKYYVWPAYNLASAVDDHLMGVTLIIRGQEHSQNEEKQKYMYKYLEWVYPHSIHIGRIKLADMVLSTSKIKEGIESGKYIGWDDPRLGTIKALRRRGFTPEALRKALLDLGAGTNDTSIALEKLYDLNRKEIDESSERMAFFEDPIELSISFCPEVNTEIPLNSDYPDKGIRAISLEKGNHKFYVSKKQLVKAGNTARIKNLYNVRITSSNDFQAEAEFIGTAKAKYPVLNWILIEEGIDAEIVMPDAGKKYGMVDSRILDLKEGKHVYLEKLGYCRLDSKDGKRIVLFFTHS